MIEVIIQANCNWCRIKMVKSWTKRRDKDWPICAERIIYISGKESLCTISPIKPVSDEKRLLYEQFLLVLLYFIIIIRLGSFEFSKIFCVREFQKWYSRWNVTIKSTRSSTSKTSASIYFCEHNYQEFHLTIYKVSLHFRPLLPLLCKNLVTF